MAKRRNEVKKETKELIYNEAIRKFSENGVNNTTVEEITKGVGIAKGTFFNYYSTKEHVLSEYYRKRMNEVLRKLAKRSYSNILDAIIDFGVTLAESAINNKTLFIHVGRSKIINRVIASEELRIADDINNYIRHLYEEFDVKMGEKEKRISIEIMFSLILATFQQWRMSEGYMDLPLLVRERFEFVFRNIN